MRYDWRSHEQVAGRALATSLAFSWVCQWTLRPQSLVDVPCGLNHKAGNWLMWWCSMTPGRKCRFAEGRIRDITTQKILPCWHKTGECALESKYKLVVQSHNLTLCQDYSTCMMRNQSALCIQLDHKKIDFDRLFGLRHTPSKFDEAP